MGSGIPNLSGAQAWPSSIIDIDSPTLGQTMTWIYHRIWAEAVPVTAHDQPWENPWDPILHLMNSGMTMESASTALGMTARTGRRRVADAMNHYGVVSHFSLGAAWNASRHRQHTGTKQPATSETALSFDPRNRLESNVVEDAHSINREQTAKVGLFPNRCFGPTS